MSKIDELLAVLGMTEGEQWKKLRPFTDASGDDYERGLYSECLRKRVLADLAFRLRDETVKAKITESYADALYMIKRKQKWHLFNVFLLNSPPIVYIVAVLIAKELAKEPK